VAVLAPGTRKRRWGSGPTRAGNFLIVNGEAFWPLSDMGQRTVPAIVTNSASGISNLYKRGSFFGAAEYDESPPLSLSFFSRWYH
jgi:hypothetical protein